MQKLVSVVITTHDRYEGLKVAINSVRKQTYKNLECIVIDDASEEPAQSMLLEYSDLRLKYKYIPKENSKGGNHARNVGVAMAEGEYIAFLDDDDEWLPEKIEKQVMIYERNQGVGLVYCGSYIKFIDEYTTMTMALPSRQFRGDLSEKVFSRIFCRTSMLLIPKSVMTEVKGFDEKLRFWQEYDLVIRICQKYKVDFVNEALVVIAQEVADKNRLSNKFAEWEKNLVYFEDKYKEYIYDDPTNKKYKKWKALVFYDAAARCEMIGDNKRQNKYLWLSWKYDKTPAKFVMAFFRLDRRKVNKLREINDLMRNKKSARSN